jgi:hypothetical protein
VNVRVFSKFSISVFPEFELEADSRLEVRLTVKNTTRFEFLL